MAPQIRSSPQGVELIFERAGLIASPSDEFMHDIVGAGIPWFKPHGIVEHEEFVLI
jgi:hypothetical protein